MDNATDLPIVVGVDGSDPSLAALHQGARISKALGLPLRVVTSWSHSTMLEGGYAVNGRSRERDARKILSNTIEKAFHGDPPPRMTSAAVDGLPAHVLLDESKRAEMLVLGSRGHGGFVGMLMGSVSSECAQRAHCPVLIVRDANSPH